PLLQKEALTFVQTLLGRDHHVVIETSGTLELDDYHALEPRENLCLSVDIKCPSSEMHDENKLEELERLTEHDQVKAVIADEDDYAYATDVLANHEIPCPVIFQPVWGSNETWLAERVLEDGLDVRFSAQLHKLLWGQKPGV
ncbi:MAG: 7-carboxy-7-deazaguanine synthase QueE, partial [Candidatus Thermoplasmatota archaeon]|nr:7-carboxy-7-deazaguanine synthase QueE [Candidatus Thermoplasmatota archaeon]